MEISTMTNYNEINITSLKPNSKLIMAYLDRTIDLLDDTGSDTVTQAILQRELNLSKRQVNYAMEQLRELDMVIELPVLGNMRTKTISINDSIVVRLENKRN